MAAFVVPDNLKNRLGRFRLSVLTMVEQRVVQRYLILRTWEEKASQGVCFLFLSYMRRLWNNWGILSHFHDISLVGQLG